MIAWIVSAITAILLVFIAWHAVSPEFREHAEAPKFRFLESLGIKTHQNNQHPKGGSR